MKKALLAVLVASAAFFVAGECQASNAVYEMVRYPTALSEYPEMDGKQLIPKAIWLIYFCHAVAIDRNPKSIS